MTKRNSGSPARKKAELRDLSVEQLSFDPMNPRLPEEFRTATQDELLRVLAEDYDLSEIAQSMVDNGYFREEPLIGVPNPLAGFTIVEGNRRLACLKMLQNPSLAKKVGLRKWPSIGERQRRDLSTVPVILYPSRDQIVPYLGFRHISGVLPWDPLSKARFMSQLIVHEGETFAQVARKIGSKAPTVRNNFVAHQLLVQAREDFGLDVSRVEQEFSLLYRALNSPSIREFIGLRIERAEGELRRPITRARRDQLQELFSWMFGEDGREPAMRESRQIDQLGEVLGSPEGIQALRTSRNLDFAFKVIGGEERRFVDNLEKASFHLDEALRDAHRQSKSSKAPVVVRRCVDSLKEIGRHFGIVLREER